MDVNDPCGSDNFYDEIDSLMPAAPPPISDFSLDDIDEILRSTNPELESSLGFENFDTTSELFNFNIKNEFLQSTNSTFGANTIQARNDSISSFEGENFNPDEFMNFLNDDKIKFEELTGDSDCSNNSIEDVLQRQRNTPSPTGSCSSSGGSSTSGIQSDASSVGSSTPAYMAQTEIKMNLESNCLDNEIGYQTLVNNAPVNIMNRLPAAAVVQTPVLQSNFIPTSAVYTTTAAATPIIQVPVKTVPVNAVNIPAINAVKVEPKLVTKGFNTSNTTATTANVNVKFVTNAATTTSPGKVTPPANAKPKTIFLSSNDFKTLMQRMNGGNGSKIVGNGAKITGAVNAHFPKIIMKTPNGKVITTNKTAQPLSVVGGGSVLSNKAFASKIVTANNAQSALKQQSCQQQKIETNNARTYKGVIDEKIFKKQQRMIKNRESASLSRKKKKEYVVSLESRINSLEKENFTLKGENKLLRSQLVTLAQTCRCKNGNVSDFILNSLKAVEQKTQPVKIAPKPAQKSLKQRMTDANLRKNLAVLFAMAFMVSLNVGSFQNFLHKNALESGMAEQTVEEPLPQVATASGGRRLLWVETEAEYNEKLNRSKREAELDMPPPPPLHFLKPINRTAAAAAAAAGQQRATLTEVKAPIDVGLNQTENLRLASNLRKWIGGNANYLNLSLGNNNDDLENPTGFRASADYYDMKSYNIPLQQGNGPGGVPQAQKRKFIVDESLTIGKQKKLETTDNDLDNSLDLFKPKISEEYLRLFKGIKRQDDTFYVLSFNMDHILLPAASYNKSARPKMALMLPAGDPALNGDVTLMQIDCEVTNTTELMLKSFMIPKKLRPNSFAKNANDVANNETAGNAGQASKTKESHYFGQSAENKEDIVEVQAKRTNIEKVVMTPKQKPVVRTFYLTGPKTQAAAEAAKKKPTIIKLSGNETLNVLGNGRNSTLFTKMRDTVTGDAKMP